MTNFTIWEAEWRSRSGVSSSSQSAQSSITQSQVNTQQNPLLWGEIFLFYVHWCFGCCRCLHEGVRTGVTDSHELPCECWELNLGSLEVPFQHPSTFFAPLSQDRFSLYSWNFLCRPGWSQTHIDNWTHFSKNNVERDTWSVFLDCCLRSDLLADKWKQSYLLPLPPFVAGVSDWFFIALECLEIEC